MFYDKFCELCKRKGVPPSKAAFEAGFSKSLVSKWKSNPEIMPSSDVLKKISDYFEITISDLLGEKENAPENGSVNDGRSKVVAIFDALPEDKQRDLLRIAEALLPPEAKP